MDSVTDYLQTVGRTERRGHCIEFCRSLHFQSFTYFFAERGKGGEKEWERNVDLCTSRTPPTRDLPATQAWALSNNHTGNLLIPKPAHSPLSHTSQGELYILKVKEGNMSNEDPEGTIRKTKEIPEERNITEAKKRDCCRDYSTALGVRVIGG